VAELGPRGEMNPWRLGAEEGVRYLLCPRQTSGALSHVLADPYACPVVMFCLPGLVVCLSGGANDRG
jgi:hypothetical protein